MTITSTGQLRNEVLDACETIDAAVFSGDILHVDAEREALNAYAERWMRAFCEHEGAEGESMQDEPLPTVGVTLLTTPHEAFTDIVGCFRAAEIEGFSECLANSDARFYDIIVRRIMPILVIAEQHAQSTAADDRHRAEQNFNAGREFEAQRLTALPPGVAWAVVRWETEVKNLPLVNIHRRTLDDTWRRVIRQFGGDPDALVGPCHDALLATRPQGDAQ